MRRSLRASSACRASSTSKESRAPSRLGIAFASTGGPASWSAYGGHRDLYAPERANDSRGLVRLLRGWPPETALPPRRHVLEGRIVVAHEHQPAEEAAGGQIGERELVVHQVALTGERVLEDLERGPEVLLRRFCGLHVVLFGGD